MVIEKLLTNEEAKIFAPKKFAHTVNISESIFLPVFLTFNGNEISIVNRVKHLIVKELCQEGE